MMRMAELRDESKGVERIIGVHNRSELVGAIKQAARSGGRVEVDWRMRLQRHEVTYAAMRAGFFSPRAGYVGPEFHAVMRGGAVREVMYMLIADL